MPRFLLFIATVTALSGCHKSSSGGASPAAPATDKPQQDVSVTESNGKVVGAVSASGDTTQVLTAGGTTPLAGTTVSFPPGAIAVGTNITLQQGQTLTAASTTGALGIGAGTVTNGSAAVVVQPSTPTTLAQPMTIALVLNQTALALLDANAAEIAILYKVQKDPNSPALSLGIIPPSQLTVQGSTVTFQILYFGVYQAVVFSTPNIQAKEVATTAPITAFDGSIAAPGLSADPGTFSVLQPAATTSLAMPDVKWSASANATTYDLTISTSSTCLPAVQSKLGITATDHIPAALADGTYYLCMNARNAAGTVLPAANAPYKFTVSAKAPGAFLITPVAAAVATATPTILWASASGASTYSAAVSTSSTCASPLQTYPSVPGTSQALTALGDGTYYVCLSAASASGVTTVATNSPLSLTIKTTPPGTFSITGSSHAAVPGMGTVLTWGASPTASQYNVLVSASDPTCATHYFASTSTGTSFPVPSASLQSGLSFACVTAVDAAGNTRVAANTGWTIYVGTLVLGQPDAVTVQSVKLGLATPYGVASDGTHVLVADQGNNRVLLWNAPPSAGAKQSAANIALGQADLSSNIQNNGGTTASSLAFPQAVAIAGIHVVVADTGNNRVLIWNSLPTASGQAADVVIGQASFSGNTANAGGPTKGTMNGPTAVTIVGTKLIVADTQNNRVLIWNNLPTTNGQAANVVVGQSSGTPIAAGTCGAATLSGPSGVASNGTHLFIADTAYNRVLSYSTIPTADGASASIALGQADLLSCAVTAASASRVYGPAGLSVNGDRLYVADNQEDRVLIFSISALANDAAAEGLLGQPDYVTDNEGPPVTQAMLTRPSAVTDDGTYVYVADQYNNRIMFYASGGALNAPPILATGALGQIDFASSSPNQVTPAVPAAAVNSPSSSATDGVRLLVADPIDYRVLIWNALPTTMNQAATLVLGQPDFVSLGLASIGPSALQHPSGICTDGTHVAIADSSLSRVLVWNTFPTTNNQAASIVLGEPDFVTVTETGVSATKLIHPQGVACAGGKLIVADTANNRVLIWNSFPTVTDKAPDVVVGQTGFGVSIAANGGQAGLSGPTGVATDGTRLVVADKGNNRVLVWNTMPTAAATPANLVIGQTDFTGYSPNGAGGSSTNLVGPTSVAFVGADLVVADSGNNRLMVWSPFPTSNDAPATSVIGQGGAPAFTSTSPNNAGVTAQTLDYPVGISADANWLYIPDSGNNRVVMLPAF